MLFRQLFDPQSSTYTYLLADAGEAVLIDPVRDQIERDVELLAELDLTLKYVLDTHVHADHVTASGLLRQRLGAKTVVSRNGGAPCADVLVGDGDEIRFGARALEVRATPGHTSGCVAYVDHAGGAAFTGDALLIRGCGRTDFQQGDPRLLYRSIHTQIFSLPDDTKLYPGHDYRGRTVTTVGEEKAHNRRLGGGRSEDEFVQIMSDLKLQYPQKIDTALPANLRCGMLPSDAMMAAEAPPELAWAPITRTAGGVPEVAPAWVEEHGHEVTLVDVREPHEFRSERGRVAGSINTPLAAIDATSRDWLPETPIVTVCLSGARSGTAARALEAKGFRVASMAGGMMRWSREGREAARG
ncbi:MAG: MBL fold metallo-hydrolase [Myxococcales bacterium]|nr:MBL fold metallo-hydrolase [Myxococcales bacterium]